MVSAMGAETKIPKRPLSNSDSFKVYHSLKVKEDISNLQDEIITSKETEKYKCYYINNYVYNVESYVCLEKN